jgi:alcohol dehydrogenase
VPHLRDRTDARVLIVGAGGCGLYATQWALSTEPRSVTYIDTSHDRLGLAEQMGATTQAWETDRRTTEKFDLLVHAAGDPDTLRFCLEAAAPEAICENLAIYFQPVELPLDSMHRSGVHLHSTFCHARPYIPEVLDALAANVIDPRLVETEVAPFDEAPTVLADPTYKPILTRPPHGAVQPSRAGRR